MPDSTKTEYQFNQVSSLIGLTHSKDGNILDQFKYTYDPVGNITEIEKYRVDIEADNGIFKYAYDPLNRLSEAICIKPNQGTSTHKTYTYDNLGNRIASTKDGIETCHTFNLRNQIIKTMAGEAETGTETITDYLYDNRGNLTQITQNGQLQSSYTFDATNMMTAAFTQDKGSAEYIYNGFRNRVKKVESYSAATDITVNIPDPCSEVRYILDMTLPYDNLLMTHKQEAKESQNQRFIWGSGLLSAYAYGDLSTDSQSTSSFHYLHDHLGSPIRLQSSIGSHSEPMSYDEFGVPEISPFTSHQRFNNPFGFTGYQADDISGMYYANARYYEPIVSRFVSEDPIKNRNNWYGYCNNNPLALIDPSGLIDIDTDISVRYFVERHGGTVCWDDRIADRAVITLNGRTVVLDRHGANLHLLDVTNEQGSLMACTLDLVSHFFPESQTQPITVIQYGNNVTIAAYVNFAGNTDATVGGRSYTQAAIEGIMSYWSGDIGGLDVITAVRDLTGVDGSSQPSLEIIIRNEAGISNFQRPSGCWSKTNPGEMTLYTSSSGGVRHTLQRARWVAAHEFGHALGVADGWGFGRATVPGVPRDDMELAATQLGNIASMMIGSSSNVTRLDMELVLRAHRTNEWQWWHYNFDLIERYGDGSIRTDRDGTRRPY